MNVNASNKPVSEHLRRASREYNSAELTALAMVSFDGVEIESLDVPDVNLNTSALNFTTTEVDRFKINYINFNFSSAATQTITITKLTGITNKDEILEVQELTGNKTARFVSISNTIIDPSKNEQLKIEVTNTGTPAIFVYTTLKIEKV